MPRDDCHLYPDTHTEADHATPPACEHEPTDDGTACRHCGLAAERADLSPDALALLIQYQATDHVGNRARWTLALTQADIDRRRADANALRELTNGEWMRYSEARVTLAPSDPNAANRQRQREHGDVWAGIRHAYNLARDGLAGTDFVTNAEYAASHDAHTERELLAGRADADGRVWTDRPPLYADGTVVACGHVVPLGYVHTECARCLATPTNTAT